MCMEYFYYEHIAIHASAYLKLQPKVPNRLLSESLTALVYFAVESAVRG